MKLGMADIKIFELEAAAKQEVVSSPVPMGSDTFFAGSEQDPSLDFNSPTSSDNKEVRVVTGGLWVHTILRASDVDWHPLHVGCE